MLTDTEIEKLKEGRDKANDFIVRRKFKKWLDGLFVVSVYILNYLPQKQLEKLIERDHINNLIFILLFFLGISGAVPITQVNGEDVVIIPDRPQRYAEPEENLLRGEIKLLIYNLFTFLSNEDVREVIQTEINYQPDYVLEKRNAPRRLSPEEAMQRVKDLLSQKEEEKEEPK